jgi:crotonobetainyl-CoA:carnitine CoA-transferase CaiB-like acyl-CoA transferase
LAAASAILVAVLERELGGEGQFIDIAEADVWATTQTGIEYLTYEVDGVGSMRERPRARRSASQFPPPRWCAQDGVLIGGLVQAAQFERFLIAIGKPEWVGDPRFANRRDLPGAAATELRAASDEWFSSHTTEQALDVLLAHKLPFTPLLTVAGLVESPQAAARGFLAAPDWSRGEPWRYPTESFIMGDSPLSPRGPAPRLGQHNAAILCDRLGYTRQELVALFQTGVI